MPLCLLVIFFVAHAAEESPQKIQVLVYTKTKTVKTLALNITNNTTIIELETLLNNTHKCPVNNNEYFITTLLNDGTKLNQGNPTLSAAPLASHTVVDVLRKTNSNVIAFWHKSLK